MSKILKLHLGCRPVFAAQAALRDLHDASLERLAQAAQAAVPGPGLAGPEVLAGEVADGLLIEQHAVVRDSDLGERAPLQLLLPLVFHFSFLVFASNDSSKLSHHC